MGWTVVSNSVNMNVSMEAIVLKANVVVNQAIEVSNVKKKCV